MEGMEGRKVFVVSKGKGREAGKVVVIREREERQGRWL